MTGFLTAEQAIELFDILSNMDDVAHRHVIDGCYARTHLMCRKIEELGYSANKAWLVEDRAKTMNPSIPGRENDEASSFTYHVAPSLPVEMPDGQIVDMVFDPSFFDGPAGVDEWAFVMDEDPPYVEIKPFGEAPSNQKGDYRIINKPMNTGPAADEDAIALMIEHQEKLSENNIDSNTRTVFKSELRAVLKADILSSEFQKAHNNSIEVIDRPKSDRLRPKRYWEIDLDDPDALDAFYD